MKKKLLFILPWFLHGGIESAFWAMYKTLGLHGEFADICVYSQSPSTKYPEGASVILPAEAVEREYDVAVCYSHYVPPNVWAEHIHAKKKIQWVHGDLSKDMIFGKWDDISHLDHIIVVSQGSLDSFLKEFPHCKDRSEVIYNIVLNEDIQQAARETPADLFSQDILNVVTVARLTKSKALDRALHVHKRLLEEGFSFCWYVVGHGEKRSALDALIKESNMQDHFILLGARENPFPYVQRADIFVLAPFFEAFGIVVTEAKILERPILVTDFSGASEQIDSGVNGLIVRNNEQSIYEGLKYLLEHPEEREKYSAALKDFTFDNSHSLKRLHELFGLKP